MDFHFFGLWKSWKINVEKEGAPCWGSPTDMGWGTTARLPPWSATSVECTTGMILSILGLIIAKRCWIIICCSNESLTAVWEHLSFTTHLNLHRPSSSIHNINAVYCSRCCKTIPVPWICRKTICARGDTICLHPLQVDNIFAFIRQVVVPFRHNNIFLFIRQVAPVPACWLFKTSATSWPLTLKVGPSHVWPGLPLYQFYSS